MLKLVYVATPEANGGSSGFLKQALNSFERWTSRRHPLLVYQVYFRTEPGDIRDVGQACSILCTADLM
jgi:NAD(P)H-dependent FMN reductase